MTNRQSNLLLAAAMLAALSGGASAAYAQTAPTDQPATAPAATAAPATTPPPAAAAPTLPNGLTAPPAGKGQVVFFRPFNMMGMALSFSVHEGAAGIGKLGVGSYFVYVGDPGPHTFTIQSEATDSVNMEIEAGETYYVKQTLGMGIVMGRPHLAMTDEATFAAKSLKLSSMKATDLAPEDVKQAAAAPAVAK